MIRFGSFELDFARHRLQCDGVEIHLPPQAFELLAILIEAAPRVVSKRELHARLWTNRIVTDATLVALVKQVRRALADNDRKSPLIRTIHRVGYAFDAPVVRRGCGSESDPGRWLIGDDRRVQLAEGDNVVGRDPQSDVWLDQPTVSRRHALVCVLSATTLVRDLGSKNKTRINGATLTENTALRDGDRIGFGTVFVTYRQLATGLPTLTQARESDRSGWRR
jgi:DNA-binding winged helix-turn-helix (wHTH) protein